MSEPNQPPRELVKMVRSALAHLYDDTFLQNHPLAAMLEGEEAHDQLSRAQRVRRLLLSCIQNLQPPPSAPAEETRAYAILEDHYLDALTMQVIAAKLGVSERQAYREHERGIRAIANLLMDRIRRHASPGPAPLAIEDRLQIAQQEAGRLRTAVHAEALDLSDLLSHIKTLLQPLSQQTGFQIELVSADQWPTIIADRMMLRQALLNLLTHALRIGGGNVVVMVTCTQSDAQIDLRGASSAHQALPVQPGTDRQADVGLAVALSLVEAQGGRLEISSAGPWNARVHLPISERATVLVIDDNADIISLFQRYLGSYPVSVAGVRDANTAVRAVSELRPQVILLDIMMPDRDGWELLQELKASPPAQDIPIILCSVLYEPQLAKAMGASGYLIKPVSQDQFLETLRPWLMPLQSAA